jgi:hypothetical protein
MLADDEVFLRIWTPSFARLDTESPLELTVKKAGQYSGAQLRRGEPQPIEASDSYEAALIGRHGQGDPRPTDASEQHFTLNQPVSFSDKCAYERVYALPAGLVLDPQKEYSISGQVRDQNKNIQLFNFTFRTDTRGQPVAY